mmetsp:Transcript_6038/g.22840  ORF Transcript_6038/g.22840 Transcript_6038/m.22840 type:complete len:143 (-) Transcript_6038:128-556(-)
MIYHWVRKNSCELTFQVLFGPFSSVLDACAVTTIHKLADCHHHQNYSHNSATKLDGCNAIRVFVSSDKNNYQTKNDSPNKNKKQETPKKTNPDAAPPIFRLFGANRSLHSQETSIVVVLPTFSVVTRIQQFINCKDENFPCI